MLPLAPLFLTALVGLLVQGSGAPPSVEEAFPEATPESQGLSAEAVQALGDELQSALERNQFVGAELLVLKNRRTVLHRCYGFADREDGELWVPGTVSNIRSMTKPITGAAAQILIDRGVLGLDDPVADWLPGFDTDAAREITVRQLLTHRAGLPMNILTSIDEFECLMDQGDAAGQRGPEFEPDSRFWYTDAGTDVLGAVVEAASGRSLDEFVQDELLTPLGMRESFYDLDLEDPRRERIASLYHGAGWTRIFDPDEKSFYPFAWGSQSLYSTPRDYARFLAMWMDGGKVGDQVILSPEAVARTLTPVSEMTQMGSEARFPTFLTGLEVWYGQMSVLHVPVGSEGKEAAQVVGHSGSDGTIAWAWPERDLMVLLFTQSRGGPSLLRIESAIDRLLISPEAWAAAATVPEELAPYLGTYVSDWANHMKEEFEVRWQAGRLVLDIPSQMEFVLDSLEGPGEGELEWSFAIAPSIRVWFERDEAGVVDCLRIAQEPLVFEAPRKGTPREQQVAERNRPDPAVVGPLLGHYLDPESDGLAEVFVDGDYLAVRTSQDQVFHLWKVPVADLWQVRESPSVTLSFQIEEGRVVSCTRHSPPGPDLVMPRKDG